MILGVAVGRVGGQLSEFDLAEVAGIASYLKAVSSGAQVLFI